MSFISAYGNLIVSDDLSGNVLGFENLVISNINGLQISNGGNAGEFIVTDGNGNLSWQTISTYSGAAGANTYVQFVGNAVGNTNFVAASEALRYDDNSVTLDVQGTIDADVLNAATLNFQTAEGITILGGSIRQAITAGPANSIYFSLPENAGFTASNLAVKTDTVLSGTTVLPQSSSQAAFLTTGTLIRVGDIISFGNDRTWLLNVTAVTNTSGAGGTTQTVTWSPATRRSLDRSNSSQKAVYVPQESSPVTGITSNSALITRSTSNVANVPTLTLSLAVPGSSSQVLYANAANTLTGSSVLNIAAGGLQVQASGSNTVGNVLANTDVIVNSNIVIGDSNVILRTNTASSHNTAIISSASNNIRTSGDLLLFDSASANTNNLTAASFRRGATRYIEYICQVSTFYVAANNVTVLVWQRTSSTSDTVADRILTPLYSYGTDPSQNVYSWVNGTGQTLYIYASLQATWDDYPRQIGGDRILGFRINGDSANMRGRTTAIQNINDYTGQSTTELIVLPSGSRFDAIAQWTGGSGSIALGSDVAGQAGRTSTRLSFFIMN